MRVPNEKASNTRRKYKTTRIVCSKCQEHVSKDNLARHVDSDICAMRVFQMNALARGLSPLNSSQARRIVRIGRIPYEPGPFAGVEIPITKVMHNGKKQKRFYQTVMYTLFVSREVALVLNNGLHKIFTKRRFRVVEALDAALYYQAFWTKLLPLAINGVHPSEVGWVQSLRELWLAGTGKETWQAFYENALDADLEDREACDVE